MLILLRWNQLAGLKGRTLWHCSYREEEGGCAEMTAWEHPLSVVLSMSDRIFL